MIEFLLIIISCFSYCFNKNAHYTVKKLLFTNSFKTITTQQTHSAIKLDITCYYIAFKQFFEDVFSIVYLLFFNYNGYFIKSKTHKVYHSFVYSFIKN